MLGCLLTQDDGTPVLWRASDRKLALVDALDSLLAPRLTTCADVKFLGLGGPTTEAACEESMDEAKDARDADGVLVSEALEAAMERSVPEREAGGVAFRTLPVCMYWAHLDSYKPSYAKVARLESTGVVATEMGVLALPKLEMEMLALPGAVVTTDGVRV